MNNFKKLLPVAMLTLAAAIVADGNVAPFIAFRSPGRDTARKVVGMSDKHTHLYDMEAFYGTFWIAPAYERSFKPGRIAECLFGSDVNDDRELLIQSKGQNFAGDAIAWQGSNFLLPEGFSSKIKFTPRVQNFLVDFHFYMALDEWCEGLYFRLYGPLVHTRYDLNAEETPVAEGAATIPAGLVDSVAVNRADTYTSALEFFNGVKQLDLTTTTVQKLTHAKFKTDKDKETCFGELRAELGYNLWLEEDYHFGLNIQAAAPTGHRPTGEYLFEAQCGNNKHWELGGGATMHYTLWRCEDGSSHFDFFSEIDVTHMFNSRQKRSFDLKNKPHSRYMLASKMGANNNLAIGAANTAATAQFANELAPVANFSSVDVKVKVNAQVDWVAMLNYTRCNWSMDLGYNLWYRSSEDIDLRSGTEDSFPANTWVLKGTTNVFGFSQGAGNAAVGLADSSSNSTIHNNNPFDGNPGATAFELNGDELTTTAGGNVLATTTPNANRVFIKLDDLDLEGAETKGISHKIFGHINYTWMDCQDWLPYIGIGASAEFGKHGNKGDNTSTSNDTLSCSLSKWSVMLKAGVSFD